MALRDLNVKIGANTTGFNRGLKDVKTGISGLKSTTTSATGAMSSGMGAFIGKLGLAALAIKGVQMAVQAASKSFNAFIAFESSAVRATELFGESSKYIKYFAENTARNFGIAESAAYKYAAVYGNLFKNITKDSTENSKVSIAMMKASAVIASKTGFTMEVVMDKIRSGMLGSTEAIDDLGVEVKVGVLEMSDAFKKIANGRSWEQLTFYEQQQVRVLGVLEQTHKNFGDTVQKGSAFSLNTLGGAFKDLTVYAGQFINAGLQPIIKGLTQLVYWAIAGMKALAGLFGLEVNMDAAADNTFAAAGAQEDLNEELKKTIKAKQKLAGFDQINVLPADTASTGTGGGTGGAGASVFDGIAMPEYDVDTSKIEEKFGRLKELFNFDNLKESWKNLKTALTPFGEKIGGGLKWLWDNILVPFGSWVIEDYAPAWLDGFSAQLKAFNSVLDALKPLGKWLWEKFLEPLAAWTGGVIVSVLGGIATAFNGISDWIDNHQTAFETLAILVGSIAAAWGLLSLAVGIWNAVAALGAFVTGAFAGAMAILTSPITLIVLAVAAVIAIVVLLVRHWDDVKVAAVACWEWIKSAWNSAAKWFDEKVITPVVTFFIGLWESIKNAFSSANTWLKDKFTSAWDAVKGVFSSVGAFFSGIWNVIKEKFTSIGTSVGDAIGGAFKKVVNSIIGFAEKTINGFIKAINGAIGLINKIPGVNIRMINEMQIPKMARGGIVSSPTLAMVGEKGKEAVMPLENNTGWIDKLAAQINSSGGGGDISLYADIYLDNGTLIDTVVRKIKRENVRSGKMVLEG